MIDTRNAQEFSIDPAKLGFALEDEIEVVWNENPVYSGPVKKIDLKESQN